MALGRLRQTLVLESVSQKSDWFPADTAGNPDDEAFRIEPGIRPHELLLADEFETLSFERAGNRYGAGPPAVRIGFILLHLTDLHRGRQRLDLRRRIFDRCSFVSGKPVLETPEGPVASFGVHFSKNNTGHVSLHFRSVWADIRT